MKKQLFSIALLLLAVFETKAQVSMPGFGKGINFEGKDSSFHIRFGFRFQNLYEANWDVNNDKISGINNFEDEVMVRRARLKFDGYAFSPKLSYKVELGLSNRDLSGGGTNHFSGANNFVYDAYIDWNFYKNLTLRFGQAKLPGNIERVISSGNLQLVDRSLLNSRFNLDRDMGIQIMNQTKISKHFLVNQTLAISQGQGRNVTDGSYNGHDFTLRIDMLPFGEFYKGKDDYVGSALHYYKKPKLMVGFTYDINQNAARTNGQLGSFIEDASGKVYGKPLQTLFVDAAFKHQRLSFMGEYAYRRTTDNDPIIYDDNHKKLGTFVTGNALNLQAGFILNGKHSIMTGQMEVVGRYTKVDLQQGTDENQYTIGFNRFISGHQLKIQIDATYRDIIGKNDGIMFRTQMDVHF